MTSGPVNVRFEHHPTGFGVGTATPRISWELPGDAGVFRQTAYEVELTGPLGVESAVVGGDDQVLAPWPFAPLGSRQRGTVRVRAASEGAWTEWSEAAAVEVALLSPDDWTATFITPKVVGAIGGAAPVLRREFNLSGPVASARLYTTALGVYEAWLNGRRVGDEVLAPGWTSFKNRLCYQSFDVTALLVEGKNSLEAMLGNGWYRGQLTWLKRRDLYGDRLAYLAQLEVTYAGGSVERLVTDDSWLAAESGVLEDDLYDGQTTDLRAATNGPWTAVEVVRRDLNTLVTAEGPPVRRVMTLPAQELITTPSGKLIVDFGQNLVGWVRLKVPNTASGDEVIVRHAEVLENGELGTRPLRKAKATDKYILKGAPLEVLEPVFTFHGFRYAEVTGAQPLELAQVEAVVVANDLARTGWFESSSADLNRLHENVVWGMRGNFLAIPTDCPQRDERLGWTGDIQVFAPTASSLFDCTGFLSSWLGDLGAEQDKDGNVPLVVPNVLPLGPPIAVWGDAACIVPWVLYERYGDVGILETQWDSMRKWVDCVASRAGDDLLWSGQFQLGDWLDPTAPPDNPAAAKADPDVIATAYFARSAEILSKCAAALGKTEAADRYGELAARIRIAFAENYVTPAGRVLSDAQTVYALAIAWSLLPTEEQRTGASRRLADLVRESGHRISTGFAGTPLILDALTDGGYSDVAYRLLFQHEVPSWMYAVSMGATTVWERWDSMLPDGSINPGEMTSFNHYALGAVADYLHRVVAGLAPLAPGYRKIIVRPVPGRALTHAKARQLTPYGCAEVGWRRQAGKFSLEVCVPQGTTAQVFVPGLGASETVGPGRHTWDVQDPVTPEAPLPPSPTVLDLLANEGAWHEFSRVLASSGEVGGTGAASDVITKFVGTPLSELLERPILGMRPLTGTTRSQLEQVIKRHSS